MGLPNRSKRADWPEIPFTDWADTCETLHLWTQVVGKIRLVQTPWINHSWHVPLYVTARGLTTSPIPYEGRSFELEFDFLEGWLQVRTAEGASRSLRLQPQPVARFYREMLATLEELKLSVRIHTVPNEIAEAIPFEEDTETREYDPQYAARFWRALVQMDRVFTEFRSRFIGKCSPVHFFWGSFDLAVTRFSGREAPPHPGGFPNLPDWVAREAYSHEVSSAGFWPGAGLGYPAFYSYAYPTPDGFSEADVEPSEAFYLEDLGEFVLPYEAVRGADSPDDMLLDFLQSTYGAAADLGEWDRAFLERELTPPPA